MQVLKPQQDPNKTSQPTYINNPKYIYFWHMSPLLTNLDLRLQSFKPNDFILRRICRF